MTTLNQRILDLAYAGHPPATIANLMGTDENTVRTAVQDLAQLPVSQGAAPAVSTPTVVSGTAQQDQTKLPSTVYVAVTGGSAGTVKVDVGPDNTVANTIVPTSDATLTRPVVFRLPAGWWFKVTIGGSAAIASAKQVTG